MSLMKSLRKTESGGSFALTRGFLKAAAEAIEAVQQEREGWNEKDAIGSRASGTTTIRPRRLRLESKR